MKTNINIIAILIYTILLPALCFAQTKSPQYDEIRFLESEFGEEMVYVKWYSHGKSPSPDFAIMQYSNEKAAEIKTVKMLYSYKDTTYYVMQDTLAIANKSAQFPLRYFIIPHDTANNPGQASEVALVSAKGNKWFTRTLAEKITLPGEGSATGNHKGIKLSWEFSDPKALNSYKILRSTVFDKNYEPLVTLSSDKTAYEDQEIIPDKVYYYKILAIPLDGNKSIASNVVFSAGFNPIPPLAPTIIDAHGIKGGVALKVKSVDPETSGIRIYRNDGITSKMEVISDLIRVPDSMITVYYDTARSLSGRRNYTYGAKAESSSFVESGLSATTYARPLINEPPSAPLTLTSYYEDGRVRLFWENMEEIDPGIAGYQISRKTVAESETYSLVHPEYMILKVNYMNDSTVEAGKTYSYKVRSVDIDGNISQNGVLTTVSVPENLPIEPFGLSGFISDGAAYLTWGETVYSDIASIRIYRYQRGSAPTIIKTLPPETLEYVDTEIKSENLYFYYLTTLNKQGNESGRSEEIGVEN